MENNFDPHPFLKYAAAGKSWPGREGLSINVDTVDSLVAAVQDAENGTTILIEDGTYRLPLGVTVTADDVILKSANGKRESVVLDGSVNHMDVDSALLQVKGAQGLVVADITFANSKKYGILIYGDSDVQNFTAHNVIFRNCWCRGLKGTDPLWPGDSRNNPRNSEEVTERVRPHEGAVQHCLFYADHIKTDREDGFDGDYISGIDMVGLSDWTFKDNVFLNIKGANGGGRGAIFVWVGSNDLRIEHNYFFSCDRSIALGNPSYDGLSVDRALIRDNQIIAGVNRAIECNSTRNVEITANRICATEDRFPVIEYIDGSEGGHLHDNVIHGRIECEEGVKVENNRISAGEDLFKDPVAGDLTVLS